MRLTACVALAGAEPGRDVAVGVGVGVWADAGAAAPSASAATRAVIRRLGIAVRVYPPINIRSPMADEFEVLPFASKDEFAAWLDAEHARADGVWIKFAKKGTSIETIVYAEALEVALC